MFMIILAFHRRRYLQIIWITGYDLRLFSIIVPNVLSWMHIIQLSHSTNLVIFSRICVILLLKPILCIIVSSRNFNNFCFTIFKSKEMKCLQCTFIIFSFFRWCPGRISIHITNTVSYFMLLFFDHYRLYRHSVIISHLSYLKMTILSSCKYCFWGYLRQYFMLKAF